MKLHKHFLPQDMVQASQEFHSAKDCLELVDLHLIAGDVASAEERVYDVLASLKVLARLAELKKRADRRNKLLNMMGQAGIDVQLIRKIKHE